MAKFFGKVGYRSGGTKETKPGVWEDVIVEKSYYGDVLRNSRGLESGDKVNNDITVGNSIRIIADAFAHENFMDILYVEWLKKKWLVSDVTVEHPRMTFRLGGLYNGDTHPAPNDA